MKINIDDYVFVKYAKTNGIVINDRGGRVGRWKVQGDDGRLWYASSRDLTVIVIDDEDEIPTKTVAVDPIDWEKRSKESLAKILKRYSK